MSFADMKRNRDNLNAKLQASLEKSENSYDKDETGFWKLTIDKKTGIGEATIRFLPPSKDNDLPYVSLFTHGFKSSLTGGWYIENSLTTIGEKDPVGEMNRELWNTEIEANKKLASERKRKLNYYANILVIKDKANPENEGKVFKFRFGKSIFDMIEAQRVPKYEDMQSVIVYDFWEGANFRLRSKYSDKKVNGKPVPTYEDSEFDRPTALFNGDDKKLEALWETQYDLREIVSKDKFKSYDELKKRLREVLGAEANNYTLFGGSIANARAGIHADAGEAAPAPSSRAKRAADLPVDDTPPAGDDTPPWGDDAPAQDAGDYFANMGKGRFND